MKFTQEEIDGMSEEEREALGDELETEGAGDEAEAETEKETEGEKEGEESNQQASQQTDQQIADQEAARQENQDEPVQTDQQDQQAPAGQSEKAEGQEGAEQDQADPNTEQKQELQGKLDELKNKFEEGEVSFEDYLDQRDEVKDQIRELELSNKVRQELEQDRVAQEKANLEAQWKADQKQFFENNKDIQENKDLLTTFQKQANIKIQDPAYDTVSNTDLLTEAAKEARAIKGVSAPANSQQEVVNARRKANQKAGEKEVQTLGDAPNAAEQETGDSRFGYLDKLLNEGKSDQLEAEIAKLTPEQQHEWEMAS